ncbi:MAG: hypothetical protein KDD58_03050 [Bdellovibrionales bacterium]|nr:hypothetical protein [Bdellovibrionales bacterium]
MSLIEVMVSLSLMGVVTMATLSLIMIINKERKNVRIAHTINQIHKKVTKYLKHPVSWQSTTSNPANPEMNCLSDNQTNCTAVVNVAIKQLNDFSGNAFYKTATQGFDLHGNVCEVTNSSCKIHVNLYWEANCSGGATSCANPEVIVHGDFSLLNVLPSDGLNINIAKYNIELYRSFGESITNPGQTLLFEEVLHEIVNRKLYIENPCNNTERYYLLGNTPKNGTPWDLAASAVYRLVKAQYDTDGNVTPGIEMCRVYLNRPYLDYFPCINEGTIPNSETLATPNILKVAANSFNPASPGSLTCDSASQFKLVKDNDNQNLKVVVKSAGGHVSEQKWQGK